MLYVKRSGIIEAKKPAGIFNLSYYERMFFMKRTVFKRLATLTLMTMLIPADAKKPTDLRFKTGDYKKRSSAERLPLPIGVSDYRLASTEYYYVDKTLPSGLYGILLR